MTKDKRVIVLTVNYKQNEYTIKCIDSILKSNYKNISVIIVDNGSTDKEHIELKKHIIDKEKVIVLRSEKNIGYVGGVNLGLQKGMKLGTDYFIVMNNDTVIDKGAISALVNCAKKYGSNTIVSGKVYHYNDKNRIQFAGYEWSNKKYLLTKEIGFNELDEGQHDTEIERDMLDDIFWLFPSKLINDIGYYSAYFWFNSEQKDFAMRAINKGYKLLYTPEAKIWHKGSITLGGRIENPAYVYWSVQSAMIFSYLHLSKKNFWKFYTLQLISFLSTFIKSVFLLLSGKNNIQYAMAKLSALKYFNKWKDEKFHNDGYNPYIG